MVIAWGHPCTMSDTMARTSSRSTISWRIAAEASSRRPRARYTSASTSVIRWAGPALDSLPYLHEFPAQALLGNRASTISGPDSPHQ